MTTFYVDPRASVGERSRIGPGAWIGPGVTIGNDCVIKPGAVIGGDGFGYERDETGRWAPKAHPYGVRIEDDVHVGANACVDRGSWRDTVIKRGARIDNLVHVAHNCEVRHDAVIVALAEISGSVIIGTRAWVGPGARVEQRLTIGAGALIGTGAVVRCDVPADQTWAGVPARCLNAEVGVREHM